MNGDGESEVESEGIEPQPESTELKALWDDREAARHPNDHGAKIGDSILRDGQPWVVVDVGALVNGRVYLHLKSTTRGVQGKAGVIPVQECGWYDGTTLHADWFDRA